MLAFQGRSGVPYDSTQGVPDAVFIVFWIIILFFLLRILWEFRDKIFRKKQKPPASNR